MFSSKWPNNPTFFSQHSKTMKHNSKKTQVQRTTTLNGMMTFGLVDNNLHILDFCSTDFAEMEPFIADCKVQAMRDGNVYITEKPKRVRNTPLFREDNCSFSLGQDGRYYFVFTMPKEQVKTLPDQLMRRALAIAKKVIGIRN